MVNNPKVPPTPESAVFFSLVLLTRLRHWYLVSSSCGPFLQQLCGVKLKGKTNLINISTTSDTFFLASDPNYGSHQETGGIAILSITKRSVFPFLFYFFNRLPETAANWFLFRFATWAFHELCWNSIRHPPRRPAQCCLCSTSTWKRRDKISYWETLP
ncbi:hypothetical protein NPIL_502711 [Nephila pilipes]|uniref:Uncharacterized protein n=1 Tax=Nephila pilipes TaxID=299642 RepID=A0A8X6PZ38_NEPPI|nr:hypothetical protein NPIL_502711 [Nephila pilipes]